MKTIFLTSAVAVALGSSALVSAQRLSPAVIAVVDTDRVSRECTACKAAQTQLQAQVSTLQARAAALRTPLETEGRAIQAAISALPAGKQPDAALQTRAQAFQTRQNTANQELGTGEQRLRSTQANVNRQITERLIPIIEAVRNTRGAALVVDKAATLASASNIDVTSDVLAQLNTQLPSVSVTPLPTPPAAAQPARPQGR